MWNNLIYGGGGNSTLLLSGVVPMSYKSKPKLPRVPLPRQTEKVHQKKSKERKVKHPRKPYNDWGLL